MNIIYGSLVIVISFMVARFFSKQSYSINVMFFAAAGLECVLVSVLGALFYFFQLGFFARLSEPKEILIRIFGLAIFLAVLVGMKTVNNAKQNRADAGLSD